VPADHGCRLDDDQSAAPIEPLGQQRQADAGRGVDSHWPNTALGVQGELTAQEEVLSTNRLVRAQPQYQPPASVFDQTGCDSQ